MGPWPVAAKDVFSRLFLGPVGHISLRWTIFLPKQPDWWEVESWTLTFDLIWWRNKSRHELKVCRICWDTSTVSPWKRSVSGEFGQKSFFSRLDRFSRRFWQKWSETSQELSVDTKKNILTTELKARDLNFPASSSTLTCNEPKFA